MSQDIINYEEINSANLAILSNLRLNFWTNIINNQELSHVKIEILDSQCPNIKCSKFIDANIKQCPHCNCEFNNKTTKVLKKVTESGKGRKPCPGCNYFIAVRTYICDCGYDHRNKIKTSPKEVENKLNNIKKKKSDLCEVGEIDDLFILIKNDCVKSNFLKFVGNSIEIDKLVNQLSKKRNDIWKFNTKLVWEFVNKFYPKSGCKHLLKADLIQEGNLGLMEAINHFDSEVKGTFGGKDETVSFSTYANYWIKKKIIDAINKYEKEIRIPEHILTIYKSFINYYNEFKLNNDREPVLEDVMRDKGLKEKKATGLLFARDYRTSIGMSMDDVNKYSDSEIENKRGFANLRFNNGSLDTFRLTDTINEEEIQFSKINWDLISFKKDKYRDVFFTLRGICGFKEIGIGDIAEKFEISKITIAKIETDTIKKIRKQLENE